MFQVFVTFFQLQSLRKYPRQPCGSFWSGLDLPGPHFDRFRLIFLQGGSGSARFELGCFGS